jgi:cytochrome c5
MKPLAMSALFIALTAAASAAGEVTWSQQIKPIFDARCAACHGSDAPEHKVFKKDKVAWVAKGVGPRMDTYTHLVSFTGWPDTGAIMRRLDDGTGKEDKKPGNMYQHLGDNDAERQANLALFKAWVGTWTLKRFDALSKEELAGIKIPY